MDFKKLLGNSIKEALKQLYDLEENQLIKLDSTKKEFEGDYTFVVFPYVRFSKKNPEETAKEIGTFLLQNNSILNFNVVKGFLNLSVNHSFFSDFVSSTFNNFDFGNLKPETIKNLVVEFSSPNTNKPLHLGHVRNNLLGVAVSNIIKANGHNISRVNLVNDRGVHICKSMLAWQKFGNGETPQSAGIKGDHLVGKYYVLFDQHYKKEIEQLLTEGLSQEEVEKKAPMMLQVQEMLLKWENNDAEVLETWKTMNSWVYEGFETTYKKLGVNFDATYYESNTYLLGKSLVQDGLDKGVFYKKEDGSVWVNLENDGLDQKLLLRSDGTSVYMTQDLGTALQRFEIYNFEKSIYVVGNEQDYHFKVLQLILQKLGYKWADGIFHLSYGMVELPHGKMKSREGTVVDADDLIDEMIASAKTQPEALGKIEDLKKEEAEILFTQIGMAALKYFILKVDPKKKMLFNPEESIDMNGNTGPFIQYTHARIKSVLRKAKEQNIMIDSKSTITDFDEKEKSVIKHLADYPNIVLEAGESLSPALIANYAYETAKLYNQFYHDLSILKEENHDKKVFRLQISQLTAHVIKHAMLLLGVNVPEKM
jgi:arginyl-tRNA synthetase